MKVGLAEEARWWTEGVQAFPWAARAEEGGRTVGRMRGLIKPYYQQYYHCHDHRKHTSDEASYVKHSMPMDSGLTDSRLLRAEGGERGTEWECLLVWSSLWVVLRQVSPKLAITGLGQHRLLEKHSQTESLSALRNVWTEMNVAMWERVVWQCGADMLHMSYGLLFYMYCLPSLLPVKAKVEWVTVSNLLLPK